jgi:hypothetical protein
MMFRHRQTAQLAKGRVNVNELNRSVATFAFPVYVWRSDNQRRSRRFLKQRHLPPQATVFAEVEAVIAPKHDDRVVPKFVLVEGVQGTELEFVIMVIAVSCVKLLSAHNSTQHTSRKHKV